jgi:predicted nuclease of predicted toxin-antitoxin system
MQHDRNIWVDAQISPFAAKSISEQLYIQAVSLRSLYLLTASDKRVFDEAKKANAIIMTKDYDFVNLVIKHGAPPHVILLTCGNTSNAVLCNLLQQLLPAALQSLQENTIVEISSKKNT